MAKVIPAVVLNIYGDEPTIRRYCRQLGIPADFVTLDREAEREIEKMRTAKMAELGIAPARKNRANTGNFLFEDAPDGIKNADMSELVPQLNGWGYKLVKMYPRRHPVRDPKTGEEKPGVVKHLLRAILSREKDEEVMDPIYTENLTSLLESGVVRHLHAWLNDYHDAFECCGGFDPNCGTIRKIVAREDGGYEVHPLKRISPQRQSA